jgi:agmatinase
MKGILKSAAASGCHTDLREEYLGERLSHSAWSGGYGTSSVTDGYGSWYTQRAREEFDWAEEGHTNLRPFDLSAAEEAAAALAESLYI